jgi:predicted NUDIX family NTP pyrophosphohydrolase
MKQSAGVLAYRKTDHGAEFFLVHPGGPFWKNKETGAWSIPKGEFTDEDPLAAARREFEEETGQPVNGNFLPLSPVKQKGGKLVYAFAVEAEVDENKITSNTCKVEWPYKSGRWITVPEVDRGGWFTPETAKRLINPSQAILLEELLEKLA